MTGLLFRLRAHLVALAALAVVVSASAFLPAARPASVQGLITPTPAPTPMPTPEPTPSPTPVPVFAPEVVAIPKLGVEAPVVPVGVEPDGTMSTPSNGTEIGWWQGASPGQGNALLAGHVNWRGAPGSFARLKELEEGDLVTVRGEGRELTFRVEWKIQVRGDSEAEDILGDVGAPVVTLITCGGEFDRSIRSHVDRIVVRGVLV